MGIFDLGGKDAKFEYLEGERVKLWTQVRALEGQLSALGGEIAFIKDDSKVIKDAVDKKTSDYEAEAKSAAKKAVECKNKSVTAKNIIDQQLSDSTDLLESIRGMHGTVESINLDLIAKLNDSTTHHNNITQIFSDLEDKKAEIEENIETIEEIFADLNTYISKIKTLDDLGVNGQETASKIEVLHKSVLSRKKEIDELYFDIIGYTEKDESGVEQTVPGLKDQLEDSFTKLENDLVKTQEELTLHRNKQVADSIEFAKQKEAQFTNTLNRWKDEYTIVLDSIKSLLPKALTAGLSHAYEAKKRHEILASKSLNKKFIGGIMGMITVSLIPFFIGIYFITTETKSLEEVIKIMPRLVLAILPLYIPVLWLAYSANKSLNLSKRLVEEYTHKEVLSKTFEGLSRQIENIEHDEISAELRIKLLYNILEVNSENPGKLITDYNKSDHPLIDALEKSIKLGDSINKLADMPGMSKLVTFLENKAKKLHEENKVRAEEGLEMLNTKEKPVKSDDRDDDE